MEKDKDLNDAIKALKALEGSPELRGYAMGQLLESYMEIEENFKNIQSIVNDRIKEQIDISIDELKSEIILIRETIKGLPSDLDQQVAAMTSVVTTAHEETLKDVNLLEERVQMANGMALKTISEAMLNSVAVFEKNMREAKDKVFGEGVEVVKETNRQMAWVIIGATVVINLVSIGVMFFTR